MTKTELLAQAGRVSEQLLDTPMNAQGRQVAQAAYQVIHELMSMLRQLGQLTAADIAKAYLEATGEALDAERLAVLCKLNDGKMVPAALKAAIVKGEIVRVKFRPEGGVKSIWHYAHAKHAAQYAQPAKPVRRVLRGMHDQHAAM